MISPTFNQIIILLKKDFTLEYRQKYAIGAVFLYVLATVYIVFTSLTRLPDELWHSLFWVIILFAAMNAVLKSFIQESAGRQIYLYTIVSPYSVLISKILYNSLVLLSISLLCFGSMVVFAGNPIQQAGLFSGAVFLGGVGLATTLTFVASVASKGSNQATLMAILGFPVVIPVLLTSLKITAQATGMVQDDEIRIDFQILIGLNILILGISLLLFPYLWKD
jgi:heme exporter protein B